jgi:hypothetical protein
MNTINILKRSLVLSGAALVIAVPAAQAHPIPWAQNSGGGMGHHSFTDVTPTVTAPVNSAPDLSSLNRVPLGAAIQQTHSLATLNQVVAPPTTGTQQAPTVANIPNVPGVQSARFSRGAAQLSEPLVVTTTHNSTNWVNIGLGALVVGFAFALLLIAATRIQPPGAPRQQS